MEIIKTDAIVLRSLKHSESSRIISFFTESSGRVSLLAKGARKAKNLVPMDTFSLMNIVYRRKASREIQLLTQAEQLNPHLGIRDNLNKMAVGFGVCELVLRMTEPDDPNPSIFQAMAETLEGLNSASANPGNYFWFFQLRLLEALGFGLNLMTCLQCGTRIEDFLRGRVKFSFEGGGLICPKCKGEAGKAAVLKPESLKALQFVSRQGVDKLGRLKPSLEAKKEIDRILTRYTGHHIEGMRKLHSRELISRV